MVAAEMRHGEWGSRIPAPLVRAFIHAAMREPAVADFVGEYIFDIATSGDEPPGDISEALRLAVDEVLNAATREDWQQVASDLIANAREFIEHRGSAAPSPKPQETTPDGWWPAPTPATASRRRRKPPVRIEQAEILAWLTERGSATTAEIASHFDISEHTAWAKADGLVCQGKLHVLPGVRGSYGHPRLYSLPATPSRGPLPPTAKQPA